MLRVNGYDHRVSVEGHYTLLEVLREQLKLFGVRDGCGIGVCGACTVLVSGRPLSSCLSLAALMEGQSITTIEGLVGPGGALHPIQEAYAECAGFQCAYCTSGFILTTKALLEEQSNPTRHEVRAFLAGNLCRCGSYVKIEEAVLEAARRLRNGCEGLSVTGTVESEVRRDARN